MLGGANHKQMVVAYSPTCPHYHVNVLTCRRVSVSDVSVFRRFGYALAA